MPFTVVLVKYTRNYSLPMAFLIHLAQTSRIHAVLAMWILCLFASFTLAPSHACKNDSSTGQV